MTDDDFPDDPHRAIVDLEALIEALSDELERCRKIVFAGKAASVAGGLALLLVLFGLLPATAAFVLGGLAAVIGGIVVFGSNYSTAQHLAERIRQAQAQRNLLIEDADLHLVTLAPSVE